MSLFADDTQKTIHKNYFVPFLSIQDPKFLVYDRNFIDQPVTNSTKIYENIGKIDTGQGVRNWLFHRLSLLRMQINSYRFKQLTNT